MHNASSTNDPGVLYNTLVEGSTNYNVLSTINRNSVYVLYDV